MNTDIEAEIDYEIQMLRTRLEYNPKTGVLMWRNGKRKNCLAGSVNSHGYSYLKVNGRVYKCHRIAFLFAFGRWPAIVDHINGVRTDNRISNLREVTQSQNRMNARRRSDNTSGFTGVKWKSNHGKWCAEIKVNGRIITIGYFDDQQSALAARRDAEVQHFGECSYATSRMGVDTAKVIK